MMLLRGSSIFFFLLLLSLPFAIWAEDIPWDKLSEDLGGSVVLREIGPIEEVFEECSSSIEAYGGALLPTVANGTCSFAGVCVFENCGVMEVDVDDDGSTSSGTFVASDESCPPEFASCADAAPCYDHTVGVCNSDTGEMLLEGEAASCADATPACDGCFPNSRCGGQKDTTVVEAEDDSNNSGLFVASDESCPPEFASCADAAPCYDHDIGLCGADGVNENPSCASAFPACNGCFPNSRCGSGGASAGSDSDGDDDDGGLFVESESCPPVFAGCADASVCFDHTTGLCGADGTIGSSDCAEALANCGPCFPNSRCQYGTIAESDSTTPSNFNTNKKLPLYSVVATTLKHIQTTVVFAAKYGIPLSIKSTGASYSNANQYNNNLLLMMSEFPKHSGGSNNDEIEESATITSSAGVLENYVDACGIDHGPAIEVGGGETWGDVFGSLAAYNAQRGDDETKYMLSSGAAVTVGASGGWLMGGGLGPFDRSMGLGIDNVLAFKVVTAPDGKVVVASECDPETSDLFWALRGGGGGNFGVVVSQISKLHPIVPLIRANLMWMGAPAVQAATDLIPTGVTLSGDMVPDNLAKGSIGTRQTNLSWTKPDPDTRISSMDQLDQWWDAMLTVLNPVTMDPRIDGYYGIGCAWAGGYMCADLYFLGTMDEFELTVLGPLREALDITAMPDAPPTETGPGAAGTGPNFIYVAQQYNDGYYSYASQDCISATEGSPQAVVCDDLGYPSANGYNTDSQVDQGGFEARLSWMIPDWIFGTGTAGNPDEPDVIERAKALFAEPLMSGVTGHVLGGNVNLIGEDLTSTSPVMRSSALEGLFPFSWIQALGIQESVDVLTKHLPAPKSNPIFNHDALNLDLLERLGKPENLSWEDLYWGNNLPRLREIKAKYDPQNVFQCRDCLAVENVDSADKDTSSSGTSRLWYNTAPWMLLGIIFLLGVY